MKKILFLLSIIFIVSACNKTLEVHPMPYDFQVKTENGIFEVKSDDNLKNYIKVVVDDENISIDDLKFEKITTAEEEFYVVYAKYTKKENQVVSLAIPLQENKAHKNLTTSNSLLLAAGCIMECIPGNNCCGCDQSITQFCKGQICNCNKSCNVPGTNTGGCTSSITFEDSNN